MASSTDTSSCLDLSFAVRGSQGTWLKNLKSDEVKSLPACRHLKCSNDGKYMAICDGNGLRVVASSDHEKTLWEVVKPKTVEMKFSPLGKYLAIWEPVSKDANSQTIPSNFHLYDWKENKLVLEDVYRKQSDWCPQWSADEFLCSRMLNGEIVFYEDHNFSGVKARLRLPKISGFGLAKSKSPYHVAVSVSGSKGEPSFVRLYQYPKFSQLSDALANKSFFKAERTELHWNDAGTAVLILTFAETSSESYYGEQHLHYISTKQESCLVPRAKNGPIYSLAWHPNSKEFCVVYGLMPAKATLYNLKCEPVFDFGTGPRNAAYFNSFGSMLCLAGFGNLKGTMEFWDVSKQKLISKVEAIDTTYFEWCPDGIHFLTATLSPRLRVNNGYKLWHYSGELKKSWQTNELYGVTWFPVIKGTLPEPDLRLTASQVAAAAAVVAAKPSAYVPPALRNRTLPSGASSETKIKFRDDYEPPSNAKELENKPMSKSALKNKKKRDSKRAKKLEGGAQNGANAAIDGEDEE